MGQFKPANKGKFQRPMQQPSQKRRIGLYEVAAVVIAIIILYALYSWISSALSISGLGSGGTLTFTSSQSLFTLGNIEYSAHLLKTSVSGGYAQVAITRLPAFINSQYYAYLYLYNSTYIATSGPNSDVKLYLTALTNTSATVAVSAVPAGSATPPTQSRIQIVSTGLVSPGTAANGTLIAITTTSSVASTTTIAATTTVASKNTTEQLQAYAILQKNGIDGLMKNFSRLYSNASSCGAVSYNTTYNTYSHTFPTGAATYSNVSKLVPDGINLTFTKVSDTSYIATYNAVYAPGQAFKTGPAVIVNINLTASAVTGTVFTGLFKDDSYATVQSIYTSANKLGMPCGVLVA